MTFSADRHARIIVIGGGAIGTSVAYHLARAGEKDVLLLEKAQITEGCTWHAAGLVGQLRSKRNLTRLMQNSVAVFDRLAEEADAAIDWKKVGSLRLASSPDRWSEIRRSMGQARSFDVECHALSAEEAAKLFPYITTEGIEGAAFIPGDGYIDPYALTQAFAKAARKYGAKIEEHTSVVEIVRRGRRILGVVTDHGTIGCDILVNCAGLWAKRVGEMAGVALAAGVVEHQYFLTEKTLDLPKDLTTLRDPDKNFYLKPDTGSFAIGGWEEGTRGCWRGKPPLDFGRELFEGNLDRLERFALPAAERLPVLNEIGIQTIINGPIPVSADGEPMMGLAPGLDNFFVACGFTAGIAASGGAGQAMSNWILEGDPGMDLWSLDVRRFGPVHAQARYLEQRAVEAYAAYYKIHWPAEESLAGRGLRRSALYEPLKARGAVFGSKFGWERPNWFRRDGDPLEDVPSFEGKPSWFDGVGEEVRAIRERVALIDQSSFSKFELRGPGTFAALQRIAANDLSGPKGKAIYTQLCNDRGGIEADVTLLHLDDDHFWLVTGSGFGVRDSDWIERQLPGAGVSMVEITGAYATINVCGPHARKVLQTVSDDDLSNEAFPFLAIRKIGLANAQALAVRVGYVGELGYELYIPQEFAAAVYEALWEAGETHGMSNAGYRAVESCRLEKGYLYWSGDISPDYNPYEAGLGFCVALEKGDFTGRKALTHIHEKGVSRKLVSLAIDGFAPLLGGEPILLDGKVVGSTTSCGYGHWTGKTIAFAYLPTKIAGKTAFEIEAFGQNWHATRGARCLYDPKMERLKA
ncbi:GcvT family protein [Limibacillus halophilus]|uniref:4-methylaminobutanoate oxidase (Formaldehyde-forming) n=1 Tax=Limibacillus halophilus TaxID=1579333 RepID=A0A839SYW5_9PROT|nr:FAD-dependent oxidoreductase [Limibacillus halophilus]MBB3066235.1 4-methylaminobutanoate oxidase (formaldehyde-forming) [Limibacillus halophilus]